MLNNSGFTKIFRHLLAKHNTETIYSKNMTGLYVMEGAALQVCKVQIRNQLERD
jgi:hypothetical protein